MTTPENFFPEKKFWLTSNRRRSFAQNQILVQGTSLTREEKNQRIKDL
jgi:hypothetical protein